MISSEALPQTAEYALADAGLHVKNGCLLKLDEHDNTVASVPIAQIKKVRCRRTFSTATLVVALFFFWLSRYFFLSTDMFLLRWLAAPVLALVGLFAVIGGVVETELVVETDDGMMRFYVPGDIRDARAFALTLATLNR